MYKTFKIRIENKLDVQVDGTIRKSKLMYVQFNPKVNNMFSLLKGTLNVNSNNFPFKE